MGSEVSFETRMKEGVAVISAVGQLDAFTASDLKVELRKLIDGHHTKLILDFQNVERVNSTAVGIILTVAKRLREQEGDLRAFGMSMEVRKVFNLLGASKILRLFDTEQETLSSFV
jgi:anti-sigma B factor antagonist